MFALPRSVYLLVISYALMNAGGALMIFIASLIAASMAPTSDQATLPVALMIIGVASGTLPLGKLQALMGRKRTFLIFATLGIVASALAALAVLQAHFLLFCGSAYALGFAMASAQQYRFAVIEYVDHHHIATATSTLLFGGLFSAFIGPEIALAGQLLLTAEFAGSFILLGLLFAICLILIILTHDSPKTLNTLEINPTQKASNGFTLIKHSKLLKLSLFSSISGFVVMSFIMTATPLTMHEHLGHSLNDTKWVIQSHIIAMYLPSLVSGWLINRLGYKRILLAGCGCYLIAIFIGFINTAFIHFWLALVLLGVGWNFLFISGTALLAYGHSKDDRFAVQSSNDFIIFSCQASAALSSGWFLYHGQWQGVLGIALVMVIIYSLYLLLQKKSLFPTP